MNVKRAAVLGGLSADCPCLEIMLTMEPSTLASQPILDAKHPRAMSSARSLRGAGDHESPYNSSFY